MKDSKPAAKRRRIQKTPRLRNPQQPARDDEGEEGNRSEEQSSTENDDNIPSTVKKRRPPRTNNNASNEDKKRDSKTSGEDNPQGGSKEGHKETKNAPKSSTPKKPREKKAPSRIIRANEFYLRKHSKSAREENPELKSKELRKLVFDRFKELPPEEKKVYEDLAAEDKARYNRELEEYKAKASE